MEEKDHLAFLKFDIEAYFPSITRTLLSKAIEWVRSLDFLSEFEEDLIMHCRRCLLVGNNGEIWRKSQDEEFDVTMGSKDSAEVSEMVGLFV